MAVFIICPSSVIFVCQQKDRRTGWKEGKEEEEDEEEEEEEEEEEDRRTDF